MRLTRKTCQELMPFARTFIIGLAIASLLVPGGLTMTLCLCDGCGWQVISTACARPCCPAPREDSGPQSPLAQQPPCAGCHLVVVKTPERETLAPVHSVQEMLPLVPHAPATIGLDMTVATRDRLALGRRGLAPAGRPQSVPLRI